MENEQQLILKRSDRKELLQDTEEIIMIRPSNNEIQQWADGQVDALEQSCVVQDQS